MTENMNIDFRRRYDAMNSRVDAALGGLTDKPIKALTLTQPWASLMANQAKTIETRSWQTHYRGLLAIHAAKGFPIHARDLCCLYPFNTGLRFAKPDELPRSRVLCIVNLIGCFKTTELHKVPFLTGQPLSPSELMFGDYREGRYAWVTEFVRLVDGDEHVDGSQGLWNWLRGPRSEVVKQEIANEAVARGEAHA